ncbi:DUF4291 domain-containing protein [Kribbella sp. NPDC058245]|uniref:DUF4291 domain-containing protein n=1 Tax=Kribbella sp. NPDC058245 TaxID=3346399 RepID=UPI0036F140C3
MTSAPYRQIRALFDDDTIAVYQAYAPEIALPALAAGTFVAPFGFSRMTWIKPSFLWMAYRSGWATKPGQTHVLRIHLKRSGFEWALANSTLSHYDPAYHSSEEAWHETLAASPVRIQWDPEQTLTLTPQPKVRSLQLGLSGPAVTHYVDDWITRIEDATPEMHHIHTLAKSDPATAQAALPQELPYPLTPALAAHLGASD